MNPYYSLNGNLWPQHVCSYSCSWHNMHNMPHSLHILSLQNPPPNMLVSLLLCIVLKG